MIDKIFKFALGVAVGLIIAILITQIFGCQSSPKKEDFPANECFYFSDCLYRSQKSVDKSPCMILAEACRDGLKEQRAYDRLKFCREKKPVEMSENECRLFLNQK